jgi:hypothetical protein
MKLNRDTKRAWIKALKSGKYNRCRSKILNRNQCGTYFNAIGVLFNTLGGIRRSKDGTVTVDTEMLNTFVNSYPNVYMDLMDISTEESQDFSYEINYIKNSL